MKKNKLWVIIPGILCAAFLLGGVWMMTKAVGQMKEYNTAIQQARQELTEADPAQAGAMEAQASALEEENAVLEENLLALQEENEALTGESTALQEQYDALAQQEDTAYYQTILESLTEGMNRVEEYINGGQ